MAAPDQTAEQPQPGAKPRKSPEALRQRWMGRIKREEEAHKKSRKQGERAMREFQGDREDGKPILYPIFWANTKITHSAIFNRQPQPEVRRRNADAGGDKQIALAMERLVEYQLDTTPFDDHANRSVNEYLVTGLGVDRLYMKTKTADVPVLNPLTGEPIEDPEKPGTPLTQSVVASQSVCLEYVPWNRFHWEPQKDWDEVQWIAFDVPMTGAQIKRDYGVDVGTSVSEGLGGDDMKTKLRANKYAQHYIVREVWDKRTRTIVTFCEGLPELWAEKPDELKLEGFFPCARPMMMDVIAGELIPIPEYEKIAPMCDEINRLTGRIKGIVENIKDVGFYDAGMGNEISQMMTESDGARVPVVAMIEKLKGTAMSSVLVLEDNTGRVNTVVALTNEREKQKAELYEVTGISDIVRGASQASETATAQQLKGQWANVRLSDKMREVSQHYRAVFRIMCELIAEHFQPEQMTAQSGVQLTPEQLQSMQSDLMRSYAIDIETDSTIAQDEAQDKADRMEFYGAFTNAMGTIMPMVSQGLMPADLANATLLFVVRSFRHGRTLEEAIEALPGTQQQLQSFQKQIQETQQQAEQAQAQAQAQIADLQKQLQEATSAKAWQQQQNDQMKAQADAAKAANDQQRARIDGIGTAAKAQLDQAHTDEIRARMVREHEAAELVGLGGVEAAYRQRQPFQ